MIGELRTRVRIGQSLEPIPHFLVRPINLFRGYDKANLRPDVIAGITVAVILLPQAIAFTVIAELPPVMGLYSALIAAVIAALWGSSNQTHTGPANAISLLVLSILVTNFTPGSQDFILAAGALAVMAGVMQLVMGLARLGLLVNFVSHSVVVGFATGAGLLIAIGQFGPLLGIPISARGVLETVHSLVTSFSDLNLYTTALGVGSIILLLGLQRIDKRLPAALITMFVTSLLVWALSLNEKGVAVIGELPQSLPPLAELPLLDVSFLTRLSTGALAVGAIGLVETVAISRSIATNTGQRLDSNQEFVGQGLANIVVGLFSGYPVAGSFSRSAVNYNAGARSPVASIFSAAFVLVAIFVAAPMAAFLPRTALSAVLIVVGVGMINRAEIARIWQGALGDALIMLVTFLGTVFLDIAFAILAGIMLSFARYILRTSMPRVHEVLPDKNFEHFIYQPEGQHCPQLGVIDILGDLYFGAVNHIEEAILDLNEKFPEQRFFLLRMHNVNNCDFSGIHMLESVVRNFRDRGGDIYLVDVEYQVDKVMKSTGFCDVLGLNNFLSGDEAIGHLFYKVLDPAVCIYECPIKVFKECQNLPKQLYGAQPSGIEKSLLPDLAKEITATALWESVRSGAMQLTVVDVREPREYIQGHIPNAELVPLPKILFGQHRFDVAQNHQIVLVCRSGRRSRRAARHIANGSNQVMILKGGMLAWEAAGLLEAID